MIDSSQAIIQFLQKKGWLKELPIIINDLKTFWDKNINKITVTTALELNESQKQTLMEKLKNKYKIDPDNVEYLIDKNILGGLVITMGDNIIDLTVSKTIERIS